MISIITWSKRIAMPEKSNKSNPESRGKSVKQKIQEFFAEELQNRRLKILRESELNPSKSILQSRS